jgi:hypothetical protein
MAARSRRHGVAGLSILLAALAGSGAVTARTAPDSYTVKGDHGSVELIAADRFRLLFPEPAGLAAAKDAIARAQASVTERAADGARVHVRLYTAVGMTEGDDEFAMRAPGRLREKRDDRETIAVGQRACSRANAGSAWSCSDTGVEYGMPGVAWDAVVAAKAIEESCGDRSCVRVTVEQAFTLPFADRSLYASNPGTAYRHFELLLALPDYEPVRIVKTDASPLSQTITSVETYELGVAIDPIELPAGKTK